MKKKLSYRDKLLELAYIYDVKEIKDYVKARKNLTTGQIELILKKNKIVVPKDYKSNFIKDNILKPISKVKSDFEEFKQEKIRDKNKLIRRAENLKYESKKRLNHSIKVLWNNLGNAGLNFLNILPKLGRTTYVFFGEIFTDLLNGIYNQQIDPKKAKYVIIGIVAVVFTTTIIFSGINYFENNEINKTVEIKKTETKKEVKKLETKKEVKKLETKKEVKKLETKKKRGKQTKIRG